MAISPDDLAQMSGLTARILAMIAVFDASSSTDTNIANHALHEAILASRALRQLAGGLNPTNPPSLMLVEAPEPKPTEVPVTAEGEEPEKPTPEDDPPAPERA